MKYFGYLEDDEIVATAISITDPDEEDIIILLIIDSDDWDHEYKTPRYTYV